MDAFFELRQNRGPTLLAGAGAGAVISSTAAETAIIPTVTIPAGLMTADGQMVQFEWHGNIVQNIDANQTLGIAAFINGVAVARQYSSTFANSATGRLMRLRGKIIRQSSTTAWMVVSFYLNAVHRTLTSDEVGIGVLASGTTFGDREIASAAAGTACTWSGPVTFSLALKMLTSSASFSQQTLHWRAWSLT